MSSDDRSREHFDLVIVGAGMAGLRAARLIASAGLAVAVLDKGRRPGGRMATRSVDDATFDTGAIAFTARTAPLRDALKAWERAGHTRRVIVDGDPALEAWRGDPTMRALPTALVTELEADPQQVDVRLATTVTALATDPRGWRIATLRDGTAAHLTASTLLMTAPAPQALALLAPGHDLGTRTTPALIAPATRALLDGVTYAPSLTVLARPADRSLAPGDLSGPPAVGAGTSAPDLVRIHHNDRTGASRVVALTLQADPAFSAARLDADRGAAAAALTAQASAAFGHPLEVVHVHGWRYAQVITGIDLDDATPALRDTSSGASLVLAGDMFGSSRAGSVPEAIATAQDSVERAFRSGTAAAGLLLDDARSATKG